MKKMKRQALVLLTTMAVVLVVGSGVALAATSAIHCPNDTSSGSPSSLLFCYGTSAADTMYGSDLADFMFSKGGNDTMHGYGGSDRLQADKGSDNVYGDDGDDAFLWGGAYVGSTNYYPDTSDDYVHGGSGNDYLVGGYAQSGVDRIYGEGGNDTIDAAQRKNPDPAAFQVTKEIIDCGAGASDVVYFDKGLDVVSNCEIKHAYS